MSCYQCLKESGIIRRLELLPLHNPNECITAPEGAMQLDLLPELPPSSGFESIVTAIEVFSRF